MAENLTCKILSRTLVEGELIPGKRIGIKADQSLSHDLNVIMTYLVLETLGLKKKRVREAFQYVDHNMLQADFKNADDHRYIAGMTKKLGITMARSGSGICHYMHLERAAKPGWLLVGGDSHTPTAGGIGSLAIGVGGFDNAMVLAGEPLYISAPKVVEVHLTGRLQPFVSAKNVILELLRRVGVKGGVGKVFEYTGPGVSTLNVSERAQIADMGAETGATSSIFPSDEATLAWLRAFKREGDYQPLAADEGAAYDELIEIDLSALEPLVAMPSSPDKVVSISEVAGTPIQQVMIGSCTNTAHQDLVSAANILKGEKVNDRVNLGIYPSSATVVKAIASDGTLTNLLTAGARVFEPSCGGCNGCGFAPATQSVSLRTTPRNFAGRSGTYDDQVYLCGPEVAAASAVTGVITDPRTLGKTWTTYQLPEQFDISPHDFLDPSAQPDEIIKGPNIRPIPEFAAMPAKLDMPVVLKAGDNISTDIICPAGANYLPIRSNIPEISKFSYQLVDKTFHDRAMNTPGSILVAGENYGQGSSREQAAIIPRYLGVQTILAKSFARLHLANLVNWGILPLTFQDPADWERIQQGDVLSIADTAQLNAQEDVTLYNLTRGEKYTCRLPIFQEDVESIRQGGTVNQIREKLKNEA